MSGPDTELKRSIEMLESSDEPEHTRPTKVARYAYVIPPRLRKTDQCPRMAPLSQPLGTGDVTIDKPHGLADGAHRSLMINTVIKDFDYRRVESESATEAEDIGDDLEYPGGLPVSLVSLYSYFLKLLLSQTSS